MFFTKAVLIRNFCNLISVKLNWMAKTMLELSLLSNLESKHVAYFAHVSNYETPRWPIGKK